MYLAKDTYHIYPKRLTLLPITLLLTYCWYQVIATYNLKTEQILQKLARDIQQLLIDAEHSIGTPEGGYTHFMPCYQDLNQRIQTFKLSQASVPHNERIVKQINLLLDVLKRTTSLHKIKFDNVDTIKLFREELRLLLNTMLTFELNKPREAI